jgi:hypothetical protein
MNTAFSQPVFAQGGSTPVFGTVAHPTIRKSTVRPRRSPYLSSRPISPSKNRSSSSSDSKSPLRVSSSSYNQENYVLEIELFPEEIPPRFTIQNIINNEVKEIRSGTIKHFKSKSVNSHEYRLIDEAIVQLDNWHKTLPDSDKTIVKIKYRNPYYSSWQQTTYGAYIQNVYGGKNIYWKHNPLKPKETFLDKIKFERTQTITLFEM